MEEFSHTVLHGENFKNKIQNLAAKKPAVSKPAAATPRSRPVPTPLHDPSRVYKTPIVPRGPLVAAAPSPEPRKQTPTPVPRPKRPDSAQRESGEAGRAVAGVSPSPRGSYLEQQRLKRAAAEEERLRKKQAELIEKQKVFIKNLILNYLKIRVILNV